MNDLETTVPQKGFMEPKERFIYRVKFTKGEEVKFIGHLDIMGVFQRAIKRAKLPIAYSQGFNPHQLMSFAHPLTLGATSMAEYADFEMSKKLQPSIVKNDLNKVLPLGILVLDTVLIHGKTENCMASLSGSEYELYLDDDITNDLIEEKLPLFLAQESIIAMKKTKSRLQEEDVKEDILGMRNCSEGGVTKICLFLASGSQRNLKPQPVIESFYKFMDKTFDNFKLRYNRLELYRMDNLNMVGLLEGIGDREFIDEETNE